MFGNTLDSLYICGNNTALMFCATPLTVTSPQLRCDVDADFFLQLWSCPLWARVCACEYVCLQRGPVMSHSCAARVALVWPLGFKERALKHYTITHTPRHALTHTQSRASGNAARVITLQTYWTPSLAFSHPQIFIYPTPHLYPPHPTFPCTFPPEFQCV